MSAAWQWELRKEKFRRELQWWQLTYQRERELRELRAENEFLRDLLARLPRPRPLTTATDFPPSRPSSHFNKVPVIES